MHKGRLKKAPTPAIAMNCWGQRFLFSSDQIPFAVSLDQVNDIVAGDMRFIQNRAIAFTITLHDPSEYLSNADITFNWDFGDESGALISRELTVTHTYITSGSFKPQVVIQAVIPDKACDPPVDPPTKAPGPPTDQGTTGRDGCCSTWETFRFPFMWSFIELVATKQLRQILKYSCLPVNLAPDVTHEFVASLY